MRFFSLLAIILCSMFLQAQSYYRSPVDFPIGLSGTFGEPRTNHFHTGIDIRTQQGVGKDIYAAADGYVSRISVSPTGYGNALYVTHPNGTTSVYGHLQSFNKKITEFITAEQYKAESFTIDIACDAARFPVKKGDIIAFSGNTGSSAGPHLHFEIRNTKTESPLNPLEWGIKIEDKNAPIIREIEIIPKNPETVINGSNNTFASKTIENAGKYRLTKKDTIDILGEVIFGIDAVDRSVGSTSGNGVYAIKLLIDGKTVFHQKMDSLSFSEGMCVNSIIDYECYLSQKQRFQTTEVTQGNALKIYAVLQGNGVFEFRTNAVHAIKYETSDFYGNTASAQFYVRTKGNLDAKRSSEVSGYRIAWNDRFDYVGDGIRFMGDSGVFFDDYLLNHSVVKAKPTFALSPLYELGDRNTPLKNYASLYLKPDENVLTQMDPEKLIVVNVVDGKQYPQSSRFEKGYVVGKIRTLGKFTVSSDTTAPKITPINITEGKLITAQGDIKVRIEDNLSGIKSYVGKLNDAWILMKFDAKNKLLEYDFDDRLKKGVNVFTLEVTDYCGNVKTLKMNLKN